VLAPRHLLPCIRSHIHSHLYHTAVHYSRLSIDEHASIYYLHQQWYTYTVCTYTFTTCVCLSTSSYVASHSTCVCYSPAVGYLFIVVVHPRPCFAACTIPLLGLIYELYDLFVCVQWCHPWSPTQYIPYYLILMTTIGVGPQSYPSL